MALKTSPSSGNGTKSDEFMRQVYRQRSSIFNVCFKRVWQYPQAYQLAEELTQAVMFKAWRNREKFRHDANLRTWLISIAMNTATDFHRRNKNKTPWKAVYLDGFESGTDHLVGLGLESENYEDVYQRQLDGKVQRRWLYAAFRKLPEHLRTVVVLRDLMEMPYVEIARSLDLPEGTMKSRLNRGRTELFRLVRAEREIEFCRLRFS